MIIIDHDNLIREISKKNMMLRKIQFMRMMKTNKIIVKMKDNYKIGVVKT